MKKLFFFAAAMFAAMTINATELFDGSHAVTWDTPLNLEAEKFADAQPGQKIVLTFTDAKEINDKEENVGSAVEFKILDVWDHLAGSREALRLYNDGTVEQFLTARAVEQLKANGLQIIGKEFTLTHVELTDGKELKEGITVWTGYYWVDGWGSLLLYQDAYKHIDFDHIEAIRYYSEAIGSNYVLKLIKTWSPAEETIATKADMTQGEGYVELALTDQIRTDLKEVAHWEIQMAKEDVDPFNLTDIVLVPKDTTTAVENIGAEAKAVKRMMNGQVVIIRDNRMYNLLGTEL